MLTEARVEALFASVFGQPPEVVAHAPGRVNLIGEHTDYNHGFVMPIATPQRTIVGVASRGGTHVRLWSASVAPGEAPFEYELGGERRTEGWGDYVQGVTVAMRAAGLPLGGFDACLDSDVPLGAGLSSSASLEIACVRALMALFRLPADDVRTAQLGHAAEVDFVGAPVGIMDQMAASLCTPDAALYLDTRSLAWERVPLPPSAELLVIDSGQKHHHVSGGYRVRRQECADAVTRLGVTSLRELSEAASSDDVLLRAARALPAPLDRRVRHVVSENARVRQMRDALAGDHLERAGALMDASHASMRDDYEVSTPEIDRLVELALAQGGVFGARLTGGGFGGSIVALVERGRAGDAGARIVSAYHSSTKYRASVRIPYAM